MAQEGCCGKEEKKVTEKDLLYMNDMIRREKEVIRAELIKRVSDERLLDSDDPNGDVIRIIREVVK